MTTHPNHPPLVAAYLRDLELLLHGLEPTERGEVLLGVRDHFEETLGVTPNDADVRAAIAELGPAVHIADEAYAAGRASSPAAPAAPAGQGRPRWVGPVIAALLTWCLFCLLLFLVTRATMTTVMWVAPAVALAIGLKVAYRRR